jgi:hypothetical protein
MKTLLTCLLCALSSLFAAPALTQAPATDGKPVHNIKLTETREIGDAAAVNDAITVLVRDAATCPAATSKDRQACACSFKDDLKKLTSAYDAAVAKHPRWNEVDVVVAYLDPANGKSVITYLPNLKKAA